MIGARIGRPASTVSREVARNGPAGRYRAVRAQALAELRARRPKTAKLAGNDELRCWVQGMLERKWSPEEISARLRLEFPGRAEMRVSHETIYQSLYVQGRGALRRELAASLRTGRALRRPRRTEGERRGKIPGMVNISERPAEAADRAVPGHWEGDLVIGKDGKTAVATLVERTSRFLILVPLTGRDSLTVGDAVIAATGGLPAQIRRSLTWDCGAEMARHATITATGLPVYFAHPHSPWERGSNENLNRIVREYFPKGVEISSDPKYLAMVACDINDRPRKIHNWKKPSELFTELVELNASTG